MSRNVARPERTKMALLLSRLPCCLQVAQSDYRISATFTRCMPSLSSPVTDQVAIAQREPFYRISLPFIASGPMPDITTFVALPFSFVDGCIVAGEPIDCPSPAAAIECARGLWRVLGHAGSVAFSRTTDFGIGKFDDKQVLCRFGQVP